MPAPTLSPVSAGGTIFANDIDSVMRWLQPLAGDTVTGNWNFTNFFTVSGQFMGVWFSITQRNSVPASVGITQSSTPTNVGAATASHLDSTGFIIFCQCTGSNSNANWVGTFTIQY